jgi:hypothetical protein
MANTELKTSILRPPKAPNLLIAPVEYTQQYQDQFSNALRLYFSQLDNFTQGINLPNSGATTGRPIDNVSVGQFYFDTTLGIPIWWNGKNWVDSSGTTV